MRESKSFMSGRSLAFNTIFAEGQRNRKAFYPTAPPHSPRLLFTCQACVRYGKEAPGSFLQRRSYTCRAARRIPEKSVRSPTGSAVRIYRTAVYPNFGAGHSPFKPFTQETSLHPGGMFFPAGERGRAPQRDSALHAFTGYSAKPSGARAPQRASGGHPGSMPLPVVRRLSFGFFC